MRRIIASLLVIVFVIALTYGNGTTVSAEEKIQKETIAYVFIGDSRTVGMNRIVHFDEKDNIFMVAKSGMGYNWFVNEGAKKLKEIRGNNEFDEWVYIFNLGVNDMGNVDKYIELVNELAKEAPLYYVSVNPTVDAVKGIQCKTIEAFNKKIIDGYENYINCYDYLKDIGYKADDGMHYDTETYTNVYEFVMTSVMVNELMRKHKDKSPKAVSYMYQ